MSWKAMEFSGIVGTGEIKGKREDAGETAGTISPADNRRSRRASVLVIGLPVDHLIEGISLTHAAKPRDVIEMLRVLDFSLLVVRAGPKDTGIWQMVQAVRRYWPQLRWALLSENCTDEQEILARSLGAASVTADPLVIIELANRRGNRK